MPNRSGIPDRWMNYSSIGRRIPGTRFVAFKVPLSDYILSRATVTSRNWWSPSQLLREVRNMGLVIDLTNTNRYYDPKEFKERGVRYVKINLEGRKIPPSRVINRFFAEVEEFCKRYPDHNKVIGVHCTHGLNRTGFLICRYMIDRLDMGADDAIRLFNRARGHSIERPIYLNNLKGIEPSPEGEERVREGFHNGAFNGQMEDLAGRFEGRSEVHWRRGNCADSYRGNYQCPTDRSLTQYGMGSDASGNDNPWQISTGGKRNRQRRRSNQFSAVDIYAPYNRGPNHNGGSSRFRWTSNANAQSSAVA